VDRLEVDGQVEKHLEVGEIGTGRNYES
jgi:hypothetical protein